MGVFAFGMSGFSVNNDDCVEYAYNAADIEIDNLYGGVTSPIVEAATIAFWYGVCTSHDGDSGGELLNPVVISN